MAKDDDKKSIGITVTKEDDIAEWYSQICLKAELADFAPVKGCMIIRPRGFAIWEAIRNYFDKNINEKTGVQNAYFPLFIPEKFFHKEAEHAEGFSPEVAWIDKDLTGPGERLAVRPTSETIMYDSYSKWIRSYKDLPLKINQWCNIVRWETEATKLFLRSREFLWQEGHCVYETLEECDKETIDYILMYQKLCEDLLALPVIVGKKTDKEKFAGAIYTLTIEALMPDGKALQCGTSHNLGQGFAKAFGISYTDKEEKEQLPWQNSWGLSTRLIGGTVMTHSDDKGLVLPPALCMNKAVIVPILFDKTKEMTLKKVLELSKEIRDLKPIVDDREDYSAGFKFNEWELKGVPIRIEVGPKDIEKKQVVIVRRDTGEKEFVPEKDLKQRAGEILKEMHGAMLDKARKNMEDNTVDAVDWNIFMKAIERRKLVKAYFCNESSCEEEIKEKSGGASTRCVLLGSVEPKGKKCVHCGKDAKVEIYFSKSY